MSNHDTAIDHRLALESALGILYRIATEPDDPNIFTAGHVRVQAAEALARLCLDIEVHPLLRQSGIMVPTRDPDDDP